MFLFYLSYYYAWILLLVFSYVWRITFNFQQGLWICKLKYFRFPFDYSNICFYNVGTVNQLMNQLYLYFTLIISTIYCWLHFLHLYSVRVCNVTSRSLGSISSSWGFELYNHDLVTFQKMLEKNSIFNEILS